MKTKLYDHLGNVEIGKESCSSFKYLGLFAQQKVYSITIDQNNYCKLLEPIEISKERSNQKVIHLVEKVDKVPYGIWP